MLRLQPFLSNLEHKQVKVLCHLSRYQPVQSYFLFREPNVQIHLAQPEFLHGRNATNPTSAH